MIKNKRYRKPKGQSKNGQSKETGNIGYTGRRNTKQEHNSICVGQQHQYMQTTQITQTKHEPAYKHLEVIFQFEAKKVMQHHLPNKTKTEKAARGFIMALFLSDWLDCRPLGRPSRFFRIIPKIIALARIIIPTGIAKA